MFTRFLELLWSACDIFSFGSKKRQRILFQLHIQNGLLLDQLNTLMDMKRAMQDFSDANRITPAYEILNQKGIFKHTIKDITKPLVAPIVGINESAKASNYVRNS